MYQLDTQVLLHSSSSALSFLLVISFCIADFVHTISIFEYHLIFESIRIAFTRAVRDWTRCRYRIGKLYSCLFAKRISFDLTGPKHPTYTRDTSCPAGPDIVHRLLSRDSNECLAIVGTSMDRGHKSSRALHVGSAIRCGIKCCLGVSKGI